MLLEDLDPVPSYGSRTLASSAYDLTSDSITYTLAPTDET